MESKSKIDNHQRFHSNLCHTTPADFDLVRTLAGVSTVAESVPGYEASGWFGVGASKTTSAEIVDRLNKEINAGFAHPNIRARLAAWVGTVIGGSPADCGKLIAAKKPKNGGQGDPCGQHQGETKPRLYSITASYAHFIHRMSALDHLDHKWDKPTRGYTLNQRRSPAPILLAR